MENKDLINQYKVLVEEIKVSENNLSTRIINNHQVSSILRQLFYFDFDITVSVIKDLINKSNTLNIDVPTIISLVFSTIDSDASDALFLSFFDDNNLFDLFFDKIKSNPSIAFFLDMTHVISNPWSNIVSILSRFCKLKNCYLLDKCLFALSRKIDNNNLYFILIKLISNIKINKKTNIIDKEILEIFNKYLNNFELEKKKKLLLEINYDNKEIDIYQVIEELSLELRNNEKKIIKNLNIYIKKDEKNAIQLLIKIILNYNIEDLLYFNFFKIRKFYYLLAKYANLRGVIFSKIPFNFGKFGYLPFDSKKEIPQEGISLLKEMIDTRLINNDQDFDLFFDNILYKVKYKNNKLYDLLLRYINTDVKKSEKNHIKYCLSRIEFDESYKDSIWFKSFYKNIDSNVDYYLNKILLQKDYQNNRALYLEYGRIISYLCEIVVKTNFSDSVKLFKKIIKINLKDYEDYYCEHIVGQDMFCKLISEYHIDNIVFHIRQDKYLENMYKEYLVRDGFYSYICDDKRKSKYIELTGCLMKLYTIHNQLQKLYKIGFLINKISFEFLLELIDLFKTHGSKSGKFSKYFVNDAVEHTYSYEGIKHANQFLEYFKIFLLLILNDDNYNQEYKARKIYEYLSNNSYFDGPYYMEILEGYLEKHDDHLFTQYQISKGDI